jgi:hypothetical protein
VIFHLRHGQDEPLPLVLPMGWKNSPPIFSTATETIADLANTCLSNTRYHSRRNHLDTLAASVDLPPAPKFPHHNVNVSVSVPVPPSCDPCLPTEGSPLQYIDIFLDDFILLAQHPFLFCVRRALLHAIDDVIRPVQPGDSPYTAVSQSQETSSG